MKTKIKFLLLSLLMAPVLLTAHATGTPTELNEVHSEEDVTVNEDLMHEHGLLNRLLLVYQEIGTRLYKNKEQTQHMALLKQATTIVREFLEDHHEQMEENYIFPVVAQDSEEFAALVKTLKEQHVIGRKLTDFILKNANNGAMKDETLRSMMIEYLDLYIRMFRPHEAREDTVVFPKFRSLLSDEEYKKMSDLFEEHEEATIGENGFDLIVENVANIEKALGIFDLNTFTPIFP
jgi:hemerythrin-like domain-containing protein